MFPELIKKTSKSLTYRSYQCNIRVLFTIKVDLRYSNHVLKKALRLSYIRRPFSPLALEPQFHDMHLHPIAEAK